MCLPSDNCFFLTSPPRLEALLSESKSGMSGLAGSWFYYLTVFQLLRDGDM